MDVDKTTQNDEEVLEANQIDDGNSTGESEGAEGESNRTYTEAELNERLEAERKERDKRWRDRIKAASGDESEKGSQESGQKADSNKVASDDVVLARLEARGILDTDEQKYLLGEAARLKKNPVELLTDDYYTNKLSSMRKDKEQAAATPPPSSRTAVNDRSSDLNYHLKQAEKGILPKD